MFLGPHGSTGGGKCLPDPFCSSSPSSKLLHQLYQYFLISSLYYVHVSNIRRSFCSLACKLMSSTADFPSCHFCLVLSHLPSPSQPAPKLPASQRPAVNNLHLDTSTRPSAAKRIFPSQVRISNCHSQLC